MNNPEQPSKGGDQDIDVNLPKRDVDEPWRHREHRDSKLDENGVSDNPVDEEPGPNDDDGLPENARRRVPS